MSPHVTDPICGMEVTPGEAAGGSAEHAGTTYWFCNPGCRERFIADPGRYLDPPKSAPTGQASAKDTRLYTCPMHPEVRQVGPGSCPKCGMALEPLRSPPPPQPDDREHRDEPELGVGDRQCPAPPPGGVVSVSRAISRLTAD